MVEPGWTIKESDLGRGARVIDHKRNPSLSHFLSHCLPLSHTYQIHKRIDTPTHKHLHTNARIQTRTHQYTHTNTHINTHMHAPTYPPTRLRAVH